MASAAISHTSTSGTIHRRASADSDATITRILNKTPEGPYSVSVPTEFAYHPLKIQHDFRHSHWDSAEQHLEYCSYLYRDTALDNSLLLLQAQDTSVSTSVRNTPLPETNPSTPSLGSTKKKISFADFKKRSKEKTQASSPKSIQSSAAPVSAVQAQSPTATTETKAVGAESAVSSRVDASKKASIHGKTADTVQEGSVEKSLAHPTTESNMSSLHANALTKHNKTKTVSQVKDKVTTKTSAGPERSGASSPGSLRNAAAISKPAPALRSDSTETPLPDHLSPLSVWVDEPSPTSLQSAAALQHNEKKLSGVYLELPSDAAFEVARKAKQASANKVSSDKPPASVQQDAKSKIVKRTSSDLEDPVDSDHHKRARTKTSNSEKSRTSPIITDKTKAASATPQASLTKGSVGRTSHAATASGGRDSLSGSSISTTPHQKWKRELSRLEAVGKQLKRDSQAGFETVRHEKNSKDHATRRKMSLVQGIESILCFMTAFCANDQIKPTHYSWRSLAVLFDEVAQRAENHSHLQGMCYLLRSVCCQRSVTILNDFKLENIKDLDKAKEHMVVVQTYVQRAAKFAQQADQLLTRSMLVSTYPKAAKILEDTPIAFAPPMPLIRCGMALLREWSAHERLRWTPSFEEGECSRL